MLENLQARVAVVTGGGHGLGRETALALSRQGALVVVADISPDAVEDVCDTIRRTGARALPCVHDISARDAFERINALCEAEAGPIDILVNNAAILVSGVPEHVPEHEWRQVIDLNLLAVMRGSLAVIPGFLARGRGHIVNVASSAALFPYSYDRISYSVSKAGVVALSEALALYLKPHGIGVTCLCPGPLDTDMIDRIHYSGPRLGLRGPGASFAKVDPARAARMIVDAIRDNVFFVPTDSALVEVMQERARDMNAFIGGKIEEMQGIPYANMG